MKIFRNLVFIAVAIIFSNVSLAQEEQDSSLSTFEQFRLTEYIHWYPAIEQQTMMNDWLKNHWRQTNGTTQKDIHHETRNA